MLAKLRIHLNKKDKDNREIVLSLSLSIVCNNAYRLLVRLVECNIFSDNLNSIISALSLALHQNDGLFF